MNWSLTSFCGPKLALSAPALFNLTFQEHEHQAPLQSTESTPAWLYISGVENPAALQLLKTGFSVVEFETAQNGQLTLHCIEFDATSSVRLISFESGQSSGWASVPIVETDSNLFLSVALDPAEVAPLTILLYDSLNLGASLDRFILPANRSSVSLLKQFLVSTEADLVLEFRRSTPHGPLAIEVIYSTNYELDGNNVLDPTRYAIVFGVICAIIGGVMLSLYLWKRCNNYRILPRPGMHHVPFQSIEIMQPDAIRPLHFSQRGLRADQIEAIPVIKITELTRAPPSIQHDPTSVPDSVPFCDELIPSLLSCAVALSVVTTMPSTTSCVSCLVVITPIDIVWIGGWPIAHCVHIADRTCFNLTLSLRPLNQLIIAALIQTFTHQQLIRLLLPLA